MNTKWGVCPVCGPTIDLELHNQRKHSTGESAMSDEKKPIPTTNPLTDGNKIIALTYDGILVGTVAHIDGSSVVLRDATHAGRGSIDGLIATGRAHRVAPIAGPVAIGRHALAIALHWPHEGDPQQLEDYETPPAAPSAEPSNSPPASP